MADEVVHGHHVGSGQGHGRADGRFRWLLIAVLAIAGIIVAVVVGRNMSPSIDVPERASGNVRERPGIAEPIEAVPAGPALVPGETLEWKADEAPAELVRRVGPLMVRITRRTEADMVAPIVRVSRGDEAVVMIGEMVGGSYTHRISAIRNIVGGSPVVMLQSFSGGAHCCNRVQLAGISTGRLKIVDLGSSDGEQTALPMDLNMDGVMDFVEQDNAFLYAFAPYAMSAAPPTVLNVVGGRVVDVSRQSGYRKLFLREMERAGETCRSATAGMDRNGACPSYVASAARVGRLDEAWDHMVASYSAAEEWENPTGCVVRTKSECPVESRIIYQSYPEALLAFLKEHGYVAADWTPRGVSTPGGDEGVGLDEPSWK